MNLKVRSQHSNHRQNSMKKVVTFFILFFAIISGLSSLYAQMDQQQPSRKHAGMFLQSSNQLELGSPSQMQASLISPAKKHSPDYLKSKSLIALNDSIYNWKWDTIANGWAIDPYYKTINIVYDAGNNLISYIRQKWDGAAWVNYEQRTYTYDANNNNTSVLYAYWDGGSWLNSDLYTYNFDANNNEISLVIQYWQSGAWVNFYQYFSTYDVNNNKTNQRCQLWNTSLWQNSWQTDYTYDVNNNMTGLLNSKWISSAWVNNYQNINMNYDVNNNMISRLSQNWVGSAWVDNWRGVYTYNTNNNITGGFEEKWTGSTWVNDWQFADTYDVNNNQLSEIGQSWNDTAWVNSYQYSYTYDANNFKIIYTYKSWNDAGTKVTEGDSIYYYFHTVAGINDLSTQGKSITIYPNPAKDYIVIAGVENSVIEIFDIHGELIRKLVSTSTETRININDLKAGVYFISARNDEFFRTIRLIKI